ncbi:MAG: Aspartate racemase, partial [uncultured bacterium]
MKTLGVIGGLGPQTTADLYRRIGELVDVSKTGQRPHIIIDSIPITTYLENENIIHEREFEPVLPYLINAAINLEKSGADFIVLACNSLHIFTKEITEAINVPFVSITDTVVQTVLEKGY